MSIPAAEHPPLTQVFIAAIVWMFGDHELVARYAMAAVGTGTIVVIGQLVKRVAGERAGLLAALLAAMYAGLWINDGLLMSESLGALLMATTLLVLFYVLEVPSIPNLALLGVLVGLLTLNRAEGVLLVPIVVLPTIWRATRGRDALRRIGACTICAAIALAVVAPWSLYNETRFKYSVPLSTNGDITLRGVNCAGSYGGVLLGTWDIACTANPLRTDDASIVALAMRHQALHYMQSHLSRLPVVVLAREGRALSLFQPIASAKLGRGEGRHLWVSLLAMAQYFLLLVPAWFGWRILQRRGVPTWPFVGPVVLVVVVVAVWDDLSRARLPVEVVLVALSAVACDAWLEQRSVTRRGQSSISEAVPKE